MEQKYGQLGKPLPLEAQFQHYAWGDANFIPRLFGLRDTGKPYAEAWFGAHPALPSLTEVGGEKLGLDRLIGERPEAILGLDVQRRFQGLPFMVKILAAARPLSIQVHPSRAQAVAGVQRENAAGIALNAPERNFHDPNHKPEVMIALTTFSALCGFRPIEQIKATLAATPEVAALLPEWRSGTQGLREMVTAYLGLPDDPLLPALSHWLERLRNAAPLPGSTEHWVLEADRFFAIDGRPDRGLFWIVLLNQIDLDPWQALYVPAGVPHAYLRGAGIEVMASSDNVLRAGLTPKHVDAQGVAAILRFDAGHVPKVATEEKPGGEVEYLAPVDEFEVSRLDLPLEDSGRVRVASGPEILLFLARDPGGSLRLESGGRVTELKHAACCLIPNGAEHRLAGGGAGTLVRVCVPKARAANRFRGRETKPLAFGTSGLRGLVTDITDLEAYVNTRGFLDYLLETGDQEPGRPVALAGDLRPSTDSPERSILRAVARAVEDAGYPVVNCGRIPTPALAYYAFQRGWPSVMVTGSHIPFDRNGIKFNKSTDEVLKTDEAGILHAVEFMRSAEYARPEDGSPFDDQGMFRSGVVSALSPVAAEARTCYVRRYLDFFPAQALAGLRVGVYQHSAVGGDILVEILSALGATVYAVARSAEFVAIDTEAITEARLAEIQGLLEQIRHRSGKIDVLVSTDGDSDRPLLVTVDPDNRARFFGGDLLGLAVADYLAADAIVVPVTATDAIELHLAGRPVQCRRTRVGSPWVIAALSSMPGDRRVGWEANGGFLTASEIERNGRRLAPLPTRDAMLPLLAVLHAACERRTSVAQLFSQFPHRFGRSDLIDVPEGIGKRLDERYSPGDAVATAVFRDEKVSCLDGDGREHQAADTLEADLLRIRDDLFQLFDRKHGFGALIRIDWLDGIRMRFEGGDVAHIRSSGNAPQLRIYAIADSEDRARAIVAMCVRQPDGLLRRLLAQL